MERLLISDNAIKFLKQKRENCIVIHRAVENKGGCIGACKEFVLKIHVGNVDESSYYFTKLEETKGISIWCENALLNKLKTNQFLIRVGGLLWKKLEIDLQPLKEVSE